VQLHRARPDHVEQVVGEDVLDRGGRLLVGSGLTLAGARGGVAELDEPVAHGLPAVAGDRLLQEPGEDAGVAVERGGGECGEGHGR
jgi:hypothetical protein